MKLPATPMNGSPLTSAWGRQVVDCLRSLIPRGAGVSRTSNGTTYDPPVNTAESPRMTVLMPAFTPIRSGNASGDPRWEFEPGLIIPNTGVAPITPTIGGISMNADPRPQIAPHATLATLVYFDIRGTFDTVDTVAITQCTIESTTGTIPASTANGTAFECRQVLCFLPPLTSDTRPILSVVGNQVLEVFAFIPYLVAQ